MSQKTRVKRERGKNVRTRQRRRRLLAVGLVGAALAGLVAVAVATLTGGSPPQPKAASQVALAGEQVPLVGGSHVSQGTTVRYNSDPPACGDHWPSPAEWGAYSSPLPDEQLVHNLEHGGIWISHKGIDQATLARLGELARKYPQAVVLTPRPQNTVPITLASWCRLEKLDVFDEQRIVAFISANINRSPEKLASVEQAALRPGAVFPAFSVTEVDARQITPASLRNRPSIVWFTTTYCVPCQIGAKRVAELDDDLGGKAFDVLVVFVDTSESPSELQRWRQQFARPDWMVAPDTDLARKVELRFLDTKYLLDRQGVIRNVDVNIADEKYLALIRQAVGQAG